MAATSSNNKENAGQDRLTSRRGTSALGKGNNQRCSAGGGDVGGDTAEQAKRLQEALSGSLAVKAALQASQAATQALTAELATTKEKLADAIAGLRHKNNQGEEEAEEEQGGGRGAPKRLHKNTRLVTLRPHEQRTQLSHLDPEDRSANYVSTWSGAVSASGVGWQWIAR